MQLFSNTTRFKLNFICYYKTLNIKIINIFIFYKYIIIKNFTFFKYTYNYYKNIWNKEFKVAKICLKTSKLNFFKKFFKYNIYINIKTVNIFKNNNNFIFKLGLFRFKNYFNLFMKYFKFNLFLNFNIFNLINIFNLMYFKKIKKYEYDFITNLRFLNNTNLLIFNFKVL